jgi:hypothetical protein
MMSLLLAARSSADGAARGAIGGGGGGGGGGAANFIAAADGVGAAGTSSLSRAATILSAVAVAGARDAARGGGLARVAGDGCADAAEAGEGGLIGGAAVPAVATVCVTLVGAGAAASGKRSWSDIHAAGAPINAISETEIRAPSCGRPRQRAGRGAVAGDGASAPSKRRSASAIAAVRLAGRGGGG